MRTLRIVGIGLLLVVTGVVGWRKIHTGFRPRLTPPSVQQINTQPSTQTSQPPPATAPGGKPVNHLGPFSIAGRDYFVELQTKKVQPGSTDEQGDTVVSMEIRDAAGVVLYRRSFPFQEKNEEFSDSWSVHARLLTGTNGKGLLVRYDAYSEPSAPEEEHTGWFQVFGVVNGKFGPFGSPLQVQGGLLDKYADAHMYKAARSLDAQADAVEFKIWAGHCRLIYPVRVDWTQGKLAPAQECANPSGGPSAGCQYNVVPDDHLSTQSVTFVRLWPNPDEKSGAPMKTVVKKDSKVDLLTALVATQWMESKAAAPSDNPDYSLDDAGGFGVVPDSDLWLKVRIDGKEGWMHSEEDFQALGLPEDE